MNGKAWIVDGLITKGIRRKWYMDAVGDPNTINSFIPLCIVNR